MLIAHIRGNGDCQSVREHSRTAAAIASSILTDVQMKQAGYLAGLLHDMGKSSEAFNRYISDSYNGKTVQKGSVVHSFAGVRYMMECFHTGKYSFPDMACELIAYAIGAHHGLFDAVDMDRQSGFKYRMEKRQEYYEEIRKNFFSECAGEQEIRALFEDAQQEITAKLQMISMLGDASDPQKSNSELYFYFGLMSRLILSAVIEGDRKDTVAFMSGNKANLFQDRNKLPEWDKILRCMEKHISSLASETPIGIARQIISDQCRAFCDRPSGLYRLNVPTGGGKTLSAMRFAVAHALKKGKRRIFYVAPLITILEQNADVIREATGDSDFVLEHHSNVIYEQDDADELHEQELLLENWDAPIIVTTLVQLLNTLFLYKTGSIRRFHALTNSVIILDEVQTVPANMLSLFNLAMNFLAEICNTTVLLCSATQPCLEKTDHAMWIKQETPVRLNDDIRLTFARTEIEVADVTQWSDIPQFIWKQMEKCQSLLVICNKKTEAEQLFNQVQGGDWKCFHLSASMCMANRRNVLTEMYAALKASRQGKEKTLCIATQVIEAGVDVSFESVIRFSAGMDSIVQAAGRCNRNGESAERAKVYILDCLDEKLNGLNEIQSGKDATRSLLYEYQKNQEKYDKNLASDKSINYYYHCLYSAMKEHYQDNAVKELDNATLFDLLGSNDKYVPDKTRYSHFMVQAFKTAGRHFSVFDNDTTDVIVPYQEGRQIIQQMMTVDVSINLKEAQSLIREAKRFTVSLYEYQVRQLKEQGAVFPVAGGAALALMEGFYSEHTGITISSQNTLFLEV